MSRSRTQFAILALVRIQPMSGYEIREFCRTRLRHFWNESFGQIYPTLTQLAADGLVRPVERADNPRATYYELTEPGRASLREWLARAASPRMVRDELLLKLFCGDEATPAVLLEHVTVARQQVQAELDSLSEASRKLEMYAHDHPDNPYWQLMLRAGRLGFEARLQWCAEAEAVIAARPGPDKETTRG